MNSCKPSSGLPCPAARLSAAASPTASIISGHSRPLLVAAGGGGSGGGGGTSRQRQARALRLRQARSDALLHCAAASADGRQASTAAADSAGSERSGSGDSSTSSSRSSSSSGAPAEASSRAGNGRSGRRREPCLPPLPFWVAGVSVVGLPEDQLVFSFLTTPEAAAAARRQLRPELPYGPSALKLATLQGDKVQAILDRWQYAVAQRELDSLDARPMLWWRYESALKGAGGGSDTGNGGSGSGSSRWYTGSSRGAATGSFADDPAAEAAAESDEAVFSKRQLRRMARAAKAAAKAAGRPQQAPPASDRAACKDGVAGSRKGADHSGGTSSNSASGSGSGSAAQQEPAGLIIDQSAFEPAWQVCTLRGLPDGTTIYKFSDEFEPVVIGPEAAPADGGAAAVEAAEAAAVAAAAGSGDAAGGALVTGFTPDGPPAGEVGMWWRQEQRPELGRLLYVQEQQRSMEGVAWSSALRLGTRFSGHAKGALHKLQIFTSEYERQQSSAVMLGSRLHPTYEKALARVKRACSEEREQEQRGWRQAAQQETAERPQRERQRQRQEARRLRSDEREERGEPQQRQQQQVLQEAAQQQQQQVLQEAAQQQQQTQQQQQHQQQHKQEQQQQDSVERGSMALLLAQQPFSKAVEHQEEEEQQQRGAATTEQLAIELAAPSSSSSSSSSAAAPADVGSEEEEEWQAELLPRPKWQAPAADQPVRPESAERGKHAAAGASLPAAEQQAQRQQQPQQESQQAAGPWARLLALAAAAGAALLSLLRPVVAALARFCLAAYRLLPLPFRRLFWRNWPPQWPSHLIPAVRQLLLARRLGAAELQAAGFNADGHSVDPLADLQAWQVERLTGCHVRDLSLYRAALTHKSALPPELRVAQSYERLEFLGDAVLSLACRTLLMERCPTSDEGEMTKLGSLLVSGASNARYAAFLGLEHYLVLDPRTLREGGQHTPHILADVFEALLGALYLDAGWAAAHTFCRRVLSACVDWSQVEADAEDWKGVFSRLAYQQRRPQPRYRTTSTRKRQFRGGLQLKWYTVDVQYGGEVVGTGSGWERRWAEQAAARQALDNMGQMPGAAAAEGAAAVE